MRHCDEERETSTPYRISSSITFKSISFNALNLMQYPVTFALPSLREVGFIRDAHYINRGPGGVGTKPDLLKLPACLPSAFAIRAGIGIVHGLMTIPDIWIRHHFTCIVFPIKEP